MNDETAVRRVCDGDRDAFEVLIRRHAGAVLSFVHRFLPSPDDAEDVSQDVFVQAFHRLHQFDPSIGQFRSWLFRIAANMSMNELRRRERRQARESIVARDRDQDGQSAGADRLDGRMSAGVREALLSLPSKERQVILLAFYHDMAYREISELLGIPLGTVKSRIHCGVTRLRRVFVPREEGESR